MNREQSLRRRIKALTWLFSFGASATLRRETPAAQEHCV
jgi:hypothetical protein